MAKNNKGLLDENADMNARVKTNNTVGPSHSQVLKEVNVSVLTENHVVIIQDKKKQKDEVVNGSKLFVEQIVSGDA